MDYQKLYSKLFNSITDTIESLKQLQIQAEEEYLNMADEEGNKVVKLNIVKNKENTPKDTVSDDE